MAENTTVENSVLAQDIRDIVANEKGVTYNGNMSFEVKLHTVDKDLNYTDGVTINSLGIVRDYKSSIADYIEIELVVFLGTYMYDIYDYLENIEVTIITRKQKHKGNKPFTRTDRYKAVYLVDKNTAHATKLTATREILNQQMPIVLTLQLLDRGAEVVRIKTVQGSFGSNVNDKNKDMKIKSFLKSVMSEEIDKILIENKKAIDSISIEEPDNQNDLGPILLKSGTRVVEVPDYIQNNNIGAYIGGIGTYIQTFGLDHFKYERTLFVYSLFNVAKYSKSEYKTIFYVPIASSHSSNEVTYKYEDEVLKILTFPVPKILEDKELKLMSTGSGFKTSAAQAYMKKPVELKEDGPHFRQDGLNTQVVTRERADGLNYAPNRGVSNNNFKLASEINEKDGTYLMIEMANVDHDFIYPGAPCKINFTNKEGKVDELYGVIVGAIVKYDTSKSSLMANFNTPKVNLGSKISVQVFVSKNKE